MLYFKDIFKMWLRKNKFIECMYYVFLFEKVQKIFSLPSCLGFKTQLYRYWNSHVILVQNLNLKIFKQYLTKKKNR